MHHSGARAVCCSMPTCQPATLMLIRKGRCEYRVQHMLQAHVAAVSSTEDVAAMMAALLRNNKVARATHNMLAYRFTTPAGSLVQDFDDDGEAAAGGRLLHLLQERVFRYLPRALVLRCSLAIALTAVTAY